MKKVLLLFLTIGMYSFLFGQGTTTGSMNGTVVDSENNPLIGATVKVTHLPSGTVAGNITDVTGAFRINNLRVGGPYEIELSYVGFDNMMIEDVFITLGETSELDFVMSDSGTVLEGIEIVGRSGPLGSSVGASTKVNADQIESMPTLDRNLNDFVRLTPQASAFGDGLSFAGVNNRFNAIYIDGAVNNDVFGLSSSGTNGGQTGIAPFSIDIIDQLQVVLSPYDVTLGGFAGGGINAVTKSGTNEFKGSLYYFNQNESLVGKTNGQLAERLGLEERVGVDEFTQQTYGFTLGGPIIKDKLFFFANAELQDDVTPDPFDPTLYTQGEGRASIEDIENLKNVLIDKYNYDPGTFGDTQDELQGTKLFGKIDYNINNDHRLTLRHQYTKAEEFSRNSGNSNTINFSNNGVYFPSTTNSTALELNSSLGNSMSNNLIIGFTDVRDDRGALGEDFPNVQIFDESFGSIRFGTEAFSTGNLLEQQILSITDNFKIFAGKHTFTIGTHNEIYNINNVFIRQNYGAYRFSSLDDFLNDATPLNYDRSYSLVDETTGDDTDAAAKFSAGQFGVYGQDEISVNRKFTLTAGLRVDVPIFFNDPEVDTYFNETALPEMQKQYEIAENVSAGQAPDAQIMLSPRVGFEYKDNFVLRGGAGIFTSRIPFVWPGAMYNNNGLTIGNVDETDLPDDFKFVSDINAQYTNPDFSIPSGDINLFTDNFKYPQVFRANLAVDKRLPGDIDFTIEGLYTKTLNNVVYTNINNDLTGATEWEGADNRIVYERQDIDPTYGGVYVGSNTNRGYTYNISASVAKSFNDVYNVFLAYNFGDAFAVNEGTSSQNSSQWRGQVNIDGRNNPVFGRSDYSQASRIIASAGYNLFWTKNKGIASRFNIFYNGQSGSAYSYVIGGSDARNISNETGSTSRNRSLVYVPADDTEINFVEYEDDNGNIVSAEDQYSRFEAFIEDDDYLSTRRGQYAEKNGARAPFSHRIDFSFRQDLGTVFGGKLNRLQLTFDVFNVANLLNKNWGVQYFIPGDFNNYDLLNYEGTNDNNEPTYTYTNDQVGIDNFNIADFSSRWRGRIGVRYIFN